MKNIAIGQIMQFDDLALALEEMGNSYSIFDDYGKSVFSIDLYIRQLKTAYKRLIYKINSGIDLFDCEKWVLDNFNKLYSLACEVKEKRFEIERLPGKYGLPRVVWFACFIVENSAGIIEEKSIRKYVDSFNVYGKFEVNELCLMDAAFKYALVKYVCVILDKVIKINRSLDNANYSVRNEKFSAGMISDKVFVYQCLNEADGELKRKIISVLDENGLKTSDIERFYAHMQATLASVISNAVESVNKLGEIFSSKFTLENSEVARMLIASRDECFVMSDEKTQLYILGKIARKKRKNESEIACCNRLTENGQASIGYAVVKKPKNALAVCYFTILWVVSFLLVLGLVNYFTNQWIWFSILPICFFGEQIFEFVAIKFVTPNLPLYKDRNKIDRRKTLIVSVNLIADKNDAQRAVEHILTLKHANYGYDCCILCDFLPSENSAFSVLEQDVAEFLRCEAVKGGFAIALRKRSKIKGERKCQGYEKKRGALINLNALLLYGEDKSFAMVVGLNGKYENVITLDEDSYITCADDLVAAIEHPYNDCAVISMKSKVLVSKASRNTYAKLYSFGVGRDSYSAGEKTFLRDVFGLSNFTGKGIYNVEKFYAVLHNAFPDNRILSHDFIEGEFAGCKNSEQEVFESVPLNYSQFLSRQLRWLRGDCQLLPYLLPKIRNKYGKKVKNPLKKISKLRILKNVAFGLNQAFRFVLIVGFISGGDWILLALAFIEQAFSVFKLLLSPPVNLRAVGCEIARVIIDTIMLPTRAFSELYAILVTFARLFRGKNLLEWKTFAKSGKGGTFWLNYAVSSVLFVGWLYFGGWFRLIFALIFAQVWLLTVIEKEKKNNAYREDREFWLGVARDTWRYFEVQFDSGKALVSDNYCETRKVAYSNMTSPTNIGFSLVSALCAFLSGFIDKQKFYKITDGVLLEISGVEKWNGHLYNWYNVNSKRVMYPSYVSTVDSGNFCMCIAFIRDYVSDNSKKIIDMLIENVDFSPLYDNKRKLLRVGYNVMSEKADESHYGLLASESLLSYYFCAMYHKLNSDCLDFPRKPSVICKGKQIKSWTGGMFEYLMSSLFIAFDEGSMLNDCVNNVVNLQSAKDMPLWGVSECQYNSLDDSGNYKYRAFGLPEIAQCEEVFDDVIAPYASIMAINNNPRRVIANAKRMTALGLYGRFGFYEAYDDGKVVKSFMSHHQGMIMLALSNYLNGIAFKRFNSNPKCSAVRLRLNYTWANVEKPEKRWKIVKSYPKNKSFLRTDFSGLVPELNFHSNGKYFMVANSYGGSFSHYDGALIYRSNGISEGFCVKCVVNNQEIVTRCQAMSDSVTEWSGENSDVVVSVKAFTLPIENGEVRKIDVKNKKDSDVRITVAVKCIPILDTEIDYYSHVEYRKLFIKTYEEDGCVWGVNKKTGIYAVMALLSGEGVQVRLDREASGGTNPYMECITGAVVPNSSSLELSGILIVGKDKSVLRRQIGVICRGNSMLFAEKDGAFLNKSYSLSVDGVNMAKGIMFFSRGSNVELCKVGYDYKNKVITDVVKSKMDVNFIKKRVKDLVLLYRYGLKFDYVVSVVEEDGYFSRLKRMTYGVVDELIKACPIGCRVDILSSCEAKQIVKLAGEFDALQKLRASNIDVFDISKGADNGELAEVNGTVNIGVYKFLKNGSFISDNRRSRPFSNIVVGKNFGFIVTDKGGGFTFGKNSREDKITDFYQDSFDDLSSERLTAKEGMSEWNLINSDKKTAKRVRVIHSYGYTQFESICNNVWSRVTLFCDKRSKIYLIDLKNISEEVKRIEISLLLDLCLGDFSWSSKGCLNFVEKDGFVEIENVRNGVKALVSSNEKFISVKFNELNKNALYSGYFRANSLKVSTMCDIIPGKIKSFYFKVGDNLAYEHVAEVRAKLDNEYAAKFSSLSCVGYSGVGSLDVLQRWIPYQVYASRYASRCGYYQVGGAWGFRDQLQDCMTLLYIDPKIVREHILLCARHQFESGDVMHWWHDPAIGVRTKIVDDRLFLPYIVSEYVAYTGDVDVLSEAVCFAEYVAIPDGQSSIYQSFSFTSNKASLFSHCILAIKSLFDFSDLNLVKMQGGDWNDAMDKVGIEGKGSSVWCSMFLYEVVNKFYKFVVDKNERIELEEKKKIIKEGVEKQFNGKWYNRAITDDGIVIGREDCVECKIDLITQAYSVISEISDKVKCQSAMGYAEQFLCDNENKIIKLLDPPFNKMQNVGYIADYPKGVRENGGQYTHAAVWFVIALYKMGEIEKAYKYLSFLNPLEHCKTEKDAEVYGAEPYVISADVYSGDKAGRAGWSWYTGSASWMYVAIVRYLFGVNIEENIVTIKPNLPQSIGNAKVCLKIKGKRLEFLIENSRQGGEWVCVVEGEDDEIKAINVDKIEINALIKVKKKNNA